MNDSIETLAATAPRRADSSGGRRLPRSLLLGGGMAVLLLALALSAPWLAPYDPNLQQLGARLLPPSALYPFGTDGFGRDVFSRVLFGVRPTLLLVSIVVLLTMPFGLAVGIVAGMAGGWVETLLMRATDLVLALPKLVLALALVATLGPGGVKGALALALTAWPVYARQARAETRLLRNSDYLAAARMLDIRGLRLCFGHVLPMCLPTAVVRAALDLGGMILAIAGLGFLGLGVQPPTAEWGAMVADGSAVIFDQWWVAMAPGCAILLASLAFNLLGDGLRDWLDPRHE
jgi:peptide/nickel transport system permease protein